MRPSAITSVLTDSARAATSSSSSQSSSTATLCGVVTFAPVKPPAASPRTASASRSGCTSSATYAQSSARAAKAAFCIRGESECATGWPSSATSLVAVEMLVVDEVVVVGGEVVMALVRLPYEVQVVDVRRIGRRLDGG